jgi:hypothetical protein
MAAKFYQPVAAAHSEGEGLVSLELHDGTVYQGYSFGAKKSVAGELGMFSFLIEPILQELQPEFHTNTHISQYFRQAWLDTRNQVRRMPFRILPILEIHRLLK